MTNRLTRGTKLVVASHNQGKVWEINQLIAPYGLNAVSASDLGLIEPEETEPTFEGNAKLKALASALVQQAPVPCLQLYEEPTYAGEVHLHLLARAQQELLATHGAKPVRGRDRLSALATVGHLSFSTIPL